MAPKRKSSVQAERPQGTGEEDSFRSIIKALRAAPADQRITRVDPICELSHRANTQVHEDYDCTLNQTNISTNTNKFYIIQLLEKDGHFFCWNRWGRVGNVGQTKMYSWNSLEDAKKDFEKKFQEKTKNKWEEREHFVAQPKKYTLIEVQGEAETLEAVEKVDGGSVRTVDVKMPLGKLSKQQIARGFEVLETLEEAIKKPTGGGQSLEELSSHFYTIIPHNFGRSRPPPINSPEILQAKKVMLLVLADIELAQTLQANGEEEKLEEVPLALDRDCELLGRQLQLLDSGGPEYKVDGGSVRTVVKPCSLDPATQKLITNIFSKEMFKNAMTLMNLDVKKMPLEKLSKQQIARGFEVLETLEEAIKKPTGGGQSLEELSSHFYTIIPHNFGRSRPPPINSPEILQAKKDMLLVLADIELAQTLQANGEEEKLKEVPHPLDRDYQLLRCQLQLLDSGGPEYKAIQTYLEQTGNSSRCPTLQHVWKVNREGEEDRFKAHSKLNNRRLLWHGTNVAVVAAILTSGLRIMPHSGGRVGKGIYFASENSKSAGYVTPMYCGNHHVGYMFLGEVALGKEHHITIDDPSLRSPPPGFDSVIARGKTEPDPTQDIELELDGQQVVVPQGRPVPCPSFQSSNFSQSEYLIYQESQCRLRYLLEIHL